MRGVTSGRIVDFTHYLCASVCSEFSASEVRSLLPTLFPAHSRVCSCQESSLLQFVSDHCRINTSPLCRQLNWSCQRTSLPDCRGPQSVPNPVFLRSSFLLREFVDNAAPTQAL